MEALTSLAQALRTQTNVKNASLEAIQASGSFFSYRESTNAFIYYNAPLLYSIPELREYNFNNEVYLVAAQVTDTFVRYNSRYQPYCNPELGCPNSGDQIIAQYLDALSYYLFHLLWKWYQETVIDQGLVRAIERIRDNLDISVGNLVRYEIIPQTVFLVVGGGQAGLLTASGLSELAGTLVLEQGQYLAYDPALTTVDPTFIQGLINTLPSSAQTSLNNYRAPPTDTTRYANYYHIEDNIGPRQLRVPIGVGNSGNLDTMYSRGFFDGMESIGGLEWGWSAMYGRYQQLISTDEHFLDHKIHITHQPKSSGIQTIFQDIVANPPSGDSGIALVDNYNKGQASVLATSSALFAYPDGLKSSAAISYLPLYDTIVVGRTPNGGAIYRRGNLTVVTGVSVDRLIIERFDNHRVLEALTNIGPIRAYSYILSAGAIGSPQILQRSGIGDPKLLERATIRPLIANSNVGKNLSIHYGPNISFTGGTTSLGAEQSSPALLRLESGRTTRLFESFFTTTGVEIPVSNYNVQPASTGIVMVSGPSGQPNINYNFYSGSDLNSAYDLVTYYSGVTGYYSPTGIDSTGAFLDYAVSYTGSYPNTKIDSTSGSLAMGKVVDRGLKVLGTQNLYVVDNSIWPLSPDGDLTLASLLVAKTFLDFRIRRL